MGITLAVLLFAGTTLAPDKKDTYRENGDISNLTEFEKTSVFKLYHINLMRAQNKSRDKFKVKFPPQDDSDEKAFIAVARDFQNFAKSMNEEFNKDTLGWVSMKQIEKILVEGRRNGWDEGVKIKYHNGMMVPELKTLAGRKEVSDLIMRFSLIEMQK